MNAEPPGKALEQSAFPQRQTVQKNAEKAAGFFAVKMNIFPLDGRSYKTGPEGGQKNFRIFDVNIANLC